jgi:rod shape-determining protein MreC
MGNGSWRISRSRGRAHLPLAVVAVLAVALILFGKAKSSLFDDARTNVGDWMRPALSFTRAPLEVAGRWMSSIGDFFWVYQENMRLKEENARLKQWHNKAQVLDERLKRYQALLHAVPDPAMSSVVARVIGRTNDPFRQTIILDAGKVNGVKPGQAVIDQRGMIGRVYLTGQRTSWVILLSDPSSRVPVSIEPNTDQAIMTGDNSPMPTIETLTHGVQLKADAQVVTSGDGDILPAGIPIGVIVPDGKSYRVALFADQTTAQDVEIVDFKLRPEHVPALSLDQLPVTAAGLPPVGPPQPGAGLLPQPVLQPPPVFRVPVQTATPPKPGTAPPATAADTDVPDNQ